MSNITTKKDIEEVLSFAKVGFFGVDDSQMQNTVFVTFYRISKFSFIRRYRIHKVMKYLKEFAPLTTLWSLRYLNSKGQCWRVISHYE